MIKNKEVIKELVDFIGDKKFNQIDEQRIEEYLNEIFEKELWDQWRSWREDGYGYAITELYFYLKEDILKEEVEIDL